MTGARSQNKWSLVDLGFKPRSLEFETQILSNEKAIYTWFSFPCSLSKLLDTNVPVPFLLKCSLTSYQRNWNVVLICIIIYLKLHSDIISTNFCETQMSILPGISTVYTRSTQLKLAVSNCLLFTKSEKLPSLLD